MKRLLFLLITITVVLAACGTNTPTKEGDHAAMDDNHGGHQSDNQVKNGTGQEHAGHGSKGGNDRQAEAVKAVWTLAGGQKPQAKQDTAIRVEIRNNGKPIENFDTNHEKKLHLIIVSQDLSFFNHIHPEFKGNGVFEIVTQFPAGGDYKLIADFVPTGGSAMTQMEWIHVEGTPGQTEPIQPSPGLTAALNGKQVTLQVDQLAAGKELTLTYTIKDEKTKAPITNLQPYLGAVGHVVILTADAEQYLHVHPVDEKASGPDAKFMTTFPKSGVYKIWGQFKHNDQVITVPFVVKVP
ncbi:hypothetical protein SAMN02799630_05523 [Paenibacillus sp. UNCCL117]|uniref:hypothetical protein n=1 Tax=unclassified Paenibacillus TaxID=185978 RepID=UPI00088EB71C|nr:MULTISPECIES: hypothetical protein [unclassified Paenibacillus]SDE48314.1 hypothetical protein SAMN04488602_1302 [Paenibacillus sp. cl123]SFW66641.1 hypothetical protein SAMN02799630_05523 [Paenibacillus sp. UNCCL117]